MNFLQWRILGKKQQSREELREREDEILLGEVEINQKRKKVDDAYEDAQRERTEAEQKNSTAAKRLSVLDAIRGKSIGALVDMFTSSMLKFLRRRNRKLADEVEGLVSNRSYKDEILVDILDQEIEGGFGNDVSEQNTQRDTEIGSGLGSMSDLDGIGFGTWGDTMRVEKRPRYKASGSVATSELSVLQPGSYVLSRRTCSSQLRVRTLIAWWAQRDSVLLRKTTAPR